MTRLRMVAPGSDSGISFNLNPECSPMFGGLQVTSAFSPVWAVMARLVGGSGAVVMLAVQVNQSAMELLE